MSGLIEGENRDQATLFPAKSKTPPERGLILEELND
jgi:hypothetical protein